MATVAATCTSIQLNTEDDQTLEQIDNYISQPREPCDSQALLKKFLTKDVFEKTKYLRTPLGGSLFDIVQSGIQNQDSEIGAYATDAASYEVFVALFDPIILAYHKLQLGFVQPPVCFGDPGLLGDPDPLNKYVKSTRIRCGRSFKGFPFNSLLRKNEYLAIESKMEQAFDSFSGELAGEYHSLMHMKDEDRQQLVKDHILFKQGDRFLQAAKACRYWPIGRGIFYNKAKTLIIWVNEEDHVRIISMQSGADLPTIYSRFIRAIEAIEAKVEFARSERLGHLTFCPTNIGTGMRVSVHIRLPKLARNRDQLNEIVRRCSLQIRGTNGEHSEVEDGLFDISNKRRCGLTEFEAVKSLQDGIAEIIRAETDAR